jgi:hypothetical protein
MAAVEDAPARILEMIGKERAADQRRVAHAGPSPSSFSQPGTRVEFVVEDAHLGTDENLRQPGAPGHPLAMGEDRNAAEIVGVRAREDDVFPGHVEGEIGHFAQIEKEVDRPLELDRVIDGVLELLVIGKT